MATISRLSILVDANASGVTKGLAPVAGQLKQFQTSVSSAASSAVDRAARIAATFLTVEKIVGRVKRAFGDLKNLGAFLSKEELANVTAMRDQWAAMNREIDLFILRVGGELAPALITIGKNLEALVAPLIGANDIIKAFGEGVNWVGAAFANVQGVVSGLFIYISEMLDLTFGKWALKFEMLKVLLEEISGKDLFANNLGRDQIKQELKTMEDLLKDAGSMLEAGLSGQAGRDFLKQVEDERKAIKSASETAQTETKKVAEMALRAQLMQPGAFNKDSAGAFSAINKARQDQLKELRRMNAQRPVVLAPANLGT
jgi:hypothetical protein